jgi:DNA-binding MarR family transcriptional regulator
LSRQLLVSNGNTTAIVDRLETDGLVRRTLPDRDRRTVIVALTAKGRGQFEWLAAEHEHEVNQMFAGLSDDDVDKLTSILKHLSEGR